MLKIYLIIFLLYTVGFAAARYVAGPELRRDLSWQLLGLILSVTALTYFGLDQFLLSLLYLACMFVGVRSRMDALCRFVLLSILTIPLAKPISLGPVYLVIFNSQMALVIGLWIALLMLPERRAVELKPMRAAEVVVWIIFLITAFGYDRTYNFTNLLRNLLTAGLGFLAPFYLVRACLSRREDLSRAFACFVGAAVVLTFFALFEAKQSWSPADVVVMRLGGSTVMAKSAFMRGGAMRASATFGTAIAFAMFMTLSVLAAGFLRDRFRSRALWRGVLLFLLVGLMVAQSRGAWIALIVAGATYYALRGKFGQLVGTGTAALAAFGLLLSLATVSPRIAAFLGTGSTGGHITDYRQVLFSRGVEEGKKAPILGQDINVIRSKMPDLRQGEGIIDFVNTYLTFFLCAGLVGLVSFVATEVTLLVGIAVEARRRATSADLRRTQYFVGAALGGLMVFIFFCSLTDRVPLLLMILLAACKTAGVRPKAARARLGARRPRSIGTAPGSVAT